MRWIYMNICGWILRIVFVYLMFVALLRLSDAFVIVLGAMFAIFYVEIFEGMICRELRKNKEAIC